MPLTPQDQTTARRYEEDPNDEKPPLIEPSKLTPGVSERIARIITRWGIEVLISGRGERTGR